MSLFWVPRPTVKYLTSILSDTLCLKWFLRFVNICLSLCLKFLCFLVRSFVKATLIASRVRE